MVCGSPTGAALPIPVDLSIDLPGGYRLAGSGTNVWQKMEWDDNLVAWSAAFVKGTADLFTSWAERFSERPNELNAPPDAVREVARQADLVLVVGSVNSSNSNRLRELAEKQGVPSYLIDGAANVREVNKAMDWDLPTEGPKTLNGLVIEYLETIPSKGTCLKIEEYPIEIVESNDNRINKLRIRAPLDT